MPDQSGRATRGRAVADLMGLGFDMIRRLSENTASRAGYRLGGLAERFDQECVGTARWYRRVAKPSNYHEAKLIGTHKRPIGGRVGGFNTGVGGS